jgi:hypothetical protein
MQARVAAAKSIRTATRIRPAIGSGHSNEDTGTRDREELVRKLRGPRTALSTRVLAYLLDGRVRR